MSKNKLNMYRVEFLLGLDAQGPWPFPDFLLNLRKAYGLSRKTVCDDLSISVVSMFCIEKGCFKKMLSINLLEVLAEYYQVPTVLLTHKCLDYIQSSEGQKRAKYKPKKTRNKSGASNEA